MTKDYDIIWLDKVDSTNEYVRRHIEDLDNLSVISAIEQTGGKGQGDHRWISEPGKNLIISILLKEPKITADLQKMISDMTADSVIRLLSGHGINAWIKPPNDIWVQDRKICGILIEHSLRGNRISWSIIGIGLNVNQTVFPEDLPNPTSMALQGQEENLENLLEEFMSIFLSHASQQLLRTDPLP